MAKKDLKEKRKVKLTMVETNRAVCEAVHSLTGMMSNYSNLSVSEVLKVVKLVEKECGADAVITLNYDDYFGSSADLVWYRLETDEEVTKRIAKAAKAKATATATRKRKAKEKAEAERAEFKRLKKKFNA